MAGGMARATTDHARASRIAAAAEGGFSEDVLLREAAFDPGVARIARRHDPFTGPAEIERQSAVLATRLAEAPKPGAAALKTASLTAAAPFRMVGALDTSRELECLTQAVYFEARGETPAGQAAVAQVVLNRVRHPSFPKSVCGVVFQGAGKRVGCQFSFACDGSMRARRESAAWERARKVATRALSGVVMAGIGEATHFHTTNVAPNWGPRLVRTAEVGMHVFYKFGRNIGRAAPKADDRVYYASFTAAPPPSVEVAADMRAAVLQVPDPAPVAETKPQLPEAAKDAGKPQAKLLPVANTPAKPAGAPKIEVPDPIVGED